MQSLRPVPTTTLSLWQNALLSQSMGAWTLVSLRGWLCLLDNAEGTAQALITMHMEEIAPTELGMQGMLQT
jgi:hypothetical protein